MMIPGKTVCPSSWIREYYGYLMADVQIHHRTKFECINQNHSLYLTVQAIQTEQCSTMLKLGVLAYALLTQMEESSHAPCAPSNI